jgi:hypothetical protein
MKHETGKHEDYEGHRIEIRKGRKKMELIIDGIPIRYGQMHDGMYFLHDYAFDHTHDLMELARRYVVYRDRANAIRRERALEKGGKCHELP